MSKYAKIFLAMTITAVASCGGGTPTSTPNSSSASSSSSTSSIVSSSSSSTVAASYTKENLAIDLADQLAASYLTLNQSFAALSTEVGSFCSEPMSTTTFASLQGVWMVAAQSWQRVQGINFGPVNDELRRYRIAFYPLNPDTLVNRIDNLIAGTDVLTASFLANKTADIQGLSALEKILFQALAFETVSAAPTSERYCSLLAAITSNLHNISMVVSNQWQSGGDYYSQFVLEENNEQSLESWFGSVAEHLEIIKNAKLLQVAIGSSADIETPLAQTSIDNIKNNFQYFLDAFYMNDESGVDYLLESVQGGVELLDLTTQADVLTALLSANTQSLVELSQSDAGVEDIEALGQAVHELLESFAIDVAGAVDVYIGFNGADGD